MSSILGMTRDTAEWFLHSIRLARKEGNDNQTLDKTTQLINKQMNAMQFTFRNRNQFDSLEKVLV